MQSARDESSSGFICMVAMWSDSFENREDGRIVFYIYTIRFHSFMAFVVDADSGV